MFKVSAKTSVFGYGGPLIVEHPRAGTPNIHHRLDRQDHAFAQPRSMSARTEVRNLRVFMKLGADTVSDKLPNHAEPGSLNVLLHCRADIANRVADFGGFNPFVE